MTTLCSEYYLPVGKLKTKNIGQIRILDFPGISEDKHYEDVVKPKILKKMKEYKKNMEQIDVALFFISNGNNRELTKSGLDLIRLLHEQKIRIIFIVNGPIRPELLQSKKIKIKNLIKNGEILNDKYSNFINTDYYQHYNNID